MWTKEHPNPPPKKPSDWYFFIFEGEEDISIVEVWPDRAYWPNGVWGERIPLPKNPLKQDKIPEQEPQKRKRGRPRKEK